MRKMIKWTVIITSILLLLRAYTHFKSVAAPIPPGVTMANLEISEIKELSEIREHLERIYNEPLFVDFAGQSLVLDPTEIGFHVEVEQMMWEASRYLHGPDFIEIALRAAAGLPQRQRDIPLRYTIDTEKLRTWLVETAAEQNSEPSIARLAPPSEQWVSGPLDSNALSADFVGTFARDWQWVAGSPGYRLDVDASIPAVIDGLLAPDERAIELTYIEQQPDPPGMADLQQAIDNYLSTFPGFAAAYVYDIPNQEEANVDADVSFSGMSTLKISLAAAVMQQMDGLPAGRKSYEIGQWIDLALGESNNYAANLLINWLGDGDTRRGARRVTAFMRELGFENTFMQSGYDARVQLPELPTPGNQREDWDTNPDSNLQSTPAEMGRILAAIYDCTQGEGLLLEIFPDEFTPEECEYILFYIGHDEFQEMAWAGVPRPNDTWFIHKHGFAFESHSDVALVWGPAGPYVLSIFLYRPQWMDWPTSNRTMKNVSRITWNFFEFQAQQMNADPGEPLELAVPPAYVPVGG